MGTAITPGAIVSIASRSGCFSGEWAVEAIGSSAALCSPPAEHPFRQLAAAADDAPELLFGLSELTLIRPGPALRICAYRGCIRLATMSAGTKGDEPWYCREHFEEVINGR